MNTLVQLIYRWAKLALRVFTFSKLKRKSVSF